MTEADVQSKTPGAAHRGVIFYCLDFMSVRILAA